MTLTSKVALAALVLPATLLLIVAPINFDRQVLSVLGCAAALTVVSWFLVLAIVTDRDPARAIPHSEVPKTGGVKNLH